MRIDAHQHFWNYSPELYGWIGEGLEVLAADHLPEHLLPHLQTASVSGTIAVQARQDLDETRWLLSLAREHESVLGVVGWVDLASDTLAEELDELAPDPYLVGVRHVLQDEPNDAHMLRPEFKRGIGQLAARGLTYDLLVFPKHLENATRLVAEFPEQPFVLDHLAKPLIAKGEREPWTQHLRTLAANENASCKLSGMVTEADWNAWTPSDLRPYLDAALEAFGPRRILFGSDWPVCKLAASYEQVLEIVKDWAGALSAEEQAALFGGNAARIYGLK